MAFAGFDEGRPMFSVEAEMGTLGAMLLSERAAEELRVMLSEEDFYRPAHRLVFRSMLGIMGRGFQIDQVTLEEELKGRGDLPNVGGPDYLLEIAMYVPSAANSTYYGEIVAEKSRLRRLDTLLRGGIGQLHGAEDEDGTAADIASAIAMELSSIGGAAAGVMSMESIDEAGGDTGVTTGFKTIDRHIATRGAALGQMAVVVAKEKAGKSTLKTQIALATARAGFGTLYISLADLSAKRLKRRWLRAMSSFSEKEVADFHGLLSEFLAAKSELERDLPIEVMDVARLGTVDVDEIIATIESHRQRRSRTGNPLQVVLIDYAQKLKSKKFKGGDRVGMYDYCSAQISSYAERSGLVIWVGSQLTDGNQKEGRDLMTKGSRAWLEDAGLVLWLDRQQGESAVLQIYRSRFGGMGKQAHLIFNKEYVRFDEVPT